MKETPSRDGNESINKNSRVRSMVSWYNHSSHRNTINIWFFSDTNWWHGSRKKYHTKNSFVNSRWSVWTFTKKKEFPVKNRTNIFWYIWRLSWSFTKSNRRSSCLSEVRSYFHCGIDMKVWLTRRPGPFAWQFQFFSWQKGHFF